jgi:predicted TIM-barrel fold metal-dependent hydrolase
MTELTIVSVDDHMVEPANLWESRLPTHLKHRGPRAVEAEDGVYWELEGTRTPFYGFNATVGWDSLSEVPKVLRWDQMRPGCFNPVERVKDMDTDGILASLCFPSSVPGFGGTVFNKLPDRELALACIRAYNDFQTDEWAAAAPDRLYAMILVPYWDPRLAAAEAERCAATGARAIACWENPPSPGFASRKARAR